MNTGVSAVAFGLVTLLAFAFTERLPAQDDPLTEIAALRKVVEEQGRRIDTLSAQVAQLLERLDTKAPAATTEPANADSPPAPPRAPLVATPLPMPPEGQLYVVERGDSLEKIAKNHGTTTAELQKLNNITDANKLQIGQKLLLPANLPEKANPQPQNQ